MSSMATCEYSAKFAALNLTNFVDWHDSWSKYLSSKDPETAGEALGKPSSGSIMLSRASSRRHLGVHRLRCTADPGPT